MSAARGAGGPLDDVPRGELARATRAGVPATRAVVQRAARKLRRGRGGERAHARFLVSLPGGAMDGRVPAGQRGCAREGDVGAR